MTQYKLASGYAAPNHSVVSGVNASGVLAGNSYPGDGSAHGFIASPGATQTFDIPNASETLITALDDAGDIVGYSVDPQNHLHGFARIQGQVKTLDTLVPSGSYVIPYSLSGSGELAGTYEKNGQTYGFTSDVDHAFEDTTTFEVPNTIGITPTSVSDSGYVTGNFQSKDGTSGGFLKLTGSVVLEFYGPNSFETQPQSVNNAGVVAGYYQDQSGSHGFTYSYAHGFATVNIPGAIGTRINGINDAGQMTGTYVDQSQQQHGFVISGDTITTLDTGDPEIDPKFINNAGVVAGNFDSADSYPFVFTPSDPATYRITASADVPEGNTGNGNTLTFTVTRSGDTSLRSTVNVALSGTATEGADYTVAGLSPLRRVGFAAGATTATFTVLTKPDTTVEADESVVATLSNSTDPSAVLSQPSATAHILDDDGVPPPAPPGGGGGGGAPAPTPPAVSPPTSTSPNAPTNNTAAPSLAFDPGITVAPGDVVTLSGTVTAGVGSLVVAEHGAALGIATVNPNGTWSLTEDFTDRPGPHTGLTATVTDAQGQTATTQSAYNFTTDLTKADTGGEPYRTVQDKLDPVTGAYTGSVFFNREGGEYLASRLSADLDGNATYTYASGTYFDDKTYTSFADHYAADGTLTQHATTTADGLQVADVLAGGQTLDAGDPAASGGTRFVFSPRLGDETIVNFVTGGPGHDRIDLGHLGAGRLASILDHAHDDGAGNTVLSIGHGNTLTLAGLAPGDLTRRDFALHA